MAVPELSSDFTTNFFNNYELFKSIFLFTLESLRITAAAGTVSRTFYSGTVIFFPDERALQPKAFFTHAARCIRFPPLCKIFTAASRRSLGRVSVPMWLIILSNQLDHSLVAITPPTN